MTKEVTNNKVRGEKIDFKEFMENLPVGIYQVDNNGKFVYCNGTIARILGYSESKKLIGRLVKDFYFNPNDRDRLMKKMRKEGGKYLDETLHWKTKQNKEIYLSDSCQFLYDDNGKEIGVRGVMVEVWYRKVFDEMNEGIYRIGTSGETLVKANHAVARMFGYKYPEEVEGLNFKYFYKSTKDLKKFKYDLYQNERVENYPVEMVTKDKQEIVVSVNASVIRDEEETIVGREGTFRDITESYKIRKILEDMPTGAYQVRKQNGKNHISYCNKAFAEMFGYSKPQEVFGKEVEEFHADINVSNEFDRALSEADAKGNSLLDYRLRVKKNTGEHFWAEVDSQLLRDHKGDIIGRQGTLRDATIKVQLEEILRRREDIQRFSHRFMAPIMSIKSSSETLIEEVKQSIEWELLGDSREILKKPHGDPFSLLKEIKNLSKKVLNILENFIALQIYGDALISQLKKFVRFVRELREVSNENRIDDIIELRETHRGIRICLFEYLIAVPDAQRDAAKILSYIEVLDKLYILYIVQTITNTSKIAYTEVENLRSYLLGWDRDKKKGEEPYEYKEENLYECIREIVNIYQIYAFEKEISIEISADPFFEIEMSKEDLKKMLHNIIQNAVKYSYRRKRNIRIRVKNMVKDVEIEISNYGVGILYDEIEQGQIFEIGYRGKLSYDWNRTGSGIGLSEAKKIAKKHGGDITVSSTPAGGPKADHKTPYITKVTIILPKFHNY